MKTPVLNERWILAFGLSIALAVQLTSVSHSNYLDSDDWFIVSMGQIVAEDPWALEHYTRFWSQEPTWRPVMTARAGLESRFFGDAPQPRVLVNIFLHLISALLLFLCLRYIISSRIAAAWSAVLFSVHPMHAETLVWFHSGFEGISVTAMVLLTLWLFASSRPTWVALLAFQFALFTRENALCIPLLITGIAFVQHRGRKLSLKLSIPYWGLLAVNVGVRLWMLSSSNDRAGLGSFHFTTDPITALVTTLGHPWLPIHPALDNRTLWWIVFTTIPFALVMSQRGLSTRALKLSFAGGLIASLPFLPQFHDANRFLEALPGGIEQRWYFFHLPLAALVIWPGWVLVSRDKKRSGWGGMAVAALAALWLTTQHFNANWWIKRCAVSSEIAQTLDNALKKRPPSIGLTIRAGSDEAEVCNQVFLNFRAQWPDASRRRLRVFKKEEGTSSLLEAIIDQNSEFTWTRTTTSPKNIQWWRWEDKTRRLKKVTTP